MCAVWCGTLKTPRVSDPNVPVCTFNTSPCLPATRAGCFSTWARVAGTHGDVLDGRTVKRVSSPVVQLKLSSGTLRRESATGWFGLSFAPFSKHIERFARQFCYSTRVLPTLRFSGCVHHLSSPDTLVLLKPLSGSRSVLCIFIYRYMF